MEDSPQQIEKETTRRRAMIAVQDSLTAEDRAAGQASAGIAELTNSQNQLEQERISGIMRLITRLQAEGKSVMEQKLALLEIKDQSSFDASIPANEASP
jgi:hypothetical protein